VPNRRSKFEINMEILTEIQNGCALPTRIMYRTNISWNPLRQTLNALSTQGLIEIAYDDADKRSKKLYRITEKGAQVLRYFNKSKELIELRGPPPLIQKF
jgi:predicted transcriptional regulator